MKKFLAPALVSVFVLSLALGVTASAAPGTQKPGDIEKVTFVHYQSDGGSDPGAPTFNDQYRLMHGGKVKWFGEHPTIEAVIDDDFTGTQATEIEESLETWDNASDWDVTTSENDVWGSDNDTVNAISWNKEDLDSDVIGVTYIWYWPDTGEIVEVGTELNKDDFDWSIDASETSEDDMDIGNIVTHEVGHWMVLEDLYQPTARDITMYGYSDYNEEKKETLATGDKAGAVDLYGEEEA